MRTRGKHRHRTNSLRVLAITLLMLLCSVAATYATTITQVTRYHEDGPDGDLIVGHYEVDGQLAFCMEHANFSPQTGTEAVKSVYNSAAVQKVLYYGYEGPAQWSGFTSMKNGIMITSLMLSEVNTSDYSVGEFDAYLSGMSDFRTFLNNQPDPDLELRFDKQSVKAYYDGTIDAERTENITVLGQGTGKLTISIPEDYILHNNDTGEDLKDSVTLTAGNSFYIKTAGEYSERKNTEIKGRNARLKPMVFATSSARIQDLTRLEAVEDTVETTKLNIEWIGKIDLVITKKDLASGKSLNGAVFKLYEYDHKGNFVSDKEITEYTIKKDGTILIKERLQCGRHYEIEEIRAPYCYKLNQEKQSFDVRGDTKTITIDFSNERQDVYLVVNKKGINYKRSGGKIVEEEVPLEGVEFEVTAASVIYKWGSEEWGSDEKFEKEVLYNPGDYVETITTDENGVASTRALPMGKYSICEIKTVDGYKIDREVRTYDLRLEPTQKELKYTINVKNKSNYVPPDTPDTPEETKDVIRTGDYNYLDVYCALAVLALLLFVTLTVLRRCDKL